MAEAPEKEVREKSLIFLLSSICFVYFHESAFEHFSGFVFDLSDNSVFDFL